jgi:hypothetical protein
MLTAEMKRVVREQRLGFVATVNATVMRGLRTVIAAVKSRRNARGSEMSSAAPSTPMLAAPRLSPGGEDQRAGTQYRGRYFGPRNLEDFIPKKRRPCSGIQSGATH